MRFTFTLYVQRHAGGSHTVSLLEVPDLEAHGVSLEYCREQIRRAVQRRIRESAASSVGRSLSSRTYRSRTVEVEVTTADARHRARRTKVPMKFLALLADYRDGVVVILPKFPLTFYLQGEDQLEPAAREEVRAFLHEKSTEEVLGYAYARSEEIEAFEVEAEPRSPEEREEDKEKSQNWALARAGENLNDRLRKITTACAHGLEGPLGALMGALSSPVRQSVILVGPSGVGKSALVEELARRIARGEVPEELQKRQVWRLNAQRIEALPIWWEAAMQDIVEECRRENHILHITAINDLLEGATTFTRGGEMARFLKDFIASGTLVVIGEATPEALTAHASAAGGFLNLFKTLRLQEPSREAIGSVLLGVRRDLEAEHRVRIDADAVDFAIDLTRRFLPYVAFPGKTAGLLKRVAARCAGERVGRAEIAREFSQQTGLPVSLLDDGVKLDLVETRAFFEERLVGQNEALEAVLDLLSIVKAGLNDPHKPLGTFLLIGPTGTGKTFLSKCLAEYLFGNADRMVRLDMSEYSGHDAVQRLTGLPGLPRGGTLTSRVIDQPFGVILLDELEKAGPDVFDILLQVLGEGRLTDSAGVTVDFRNSVVMMTSNLGAQRRGSSSLGFASAGPDARAQYMGEIEGFFRPEFVNRIDKVVVFHPLGREAMEKIVRRELDLLLSREGLARRRSLVEIDDGVVSLLLEKGFDPDYGARPLKRAIEQCVAAPLARFLAGAAPSDTLSLRVLREKDGTRVQGVPIREAKPRVRTALAGLSEIVPGASRRRSLSDLLRETTDVRRRLREWHQSEKAASMRRELRKLLEESSRKRSQKRPGDEIRRDMRRVYHLERVLKRLDQLLSDSEFLEEMIDLVHRDKDRGLLPEVGRKYEELQLAAGFLEIELALSSEGANDNAVVTISRFGTDASEASSAAWLRAVAKMYGRWLHRKGFTYEFVNVVLPRQKGEDPTMEPVGADHVQDVLRRIDDVRLPARLVCFAEGANVAGFLRGEQGLHRLRGKLHEHDAGASTTRLVRVCVASAPEAVPAQWWTQVMSRARGERGQKQVSWEFALQSEEERGLDEIVRSYQITEETRRVEDPRTGLEVASVSDVLEGDLDPFILAFLRSQMEEERGQRQE